MEQPPLIDVEPEDGGKFSLMGRGGCLGKLVLLIAGFLILSIVLLGLAFFVWGGDPKGKAGEEGVGTELVEKKGVAGILDKVRRAVKGEKAVPTEADGAVSGEGGAAAGQQGVAGGDGTTGVVEKSSGSAVSLEESARLLKGKKGHLEEDGPEGRSGEAAGGEAIVKGGPEVRTRRGGSFGSSVGVATIAGTRNQYQRWRGDFSTSGSDLEFEVIYQEVGDQLQFRCFVMPYDSETAKLFRADKGDFLLSFNDASGKRSVPAEADLAIALTKLTAFESKGTVAGWVARGMIPMKGQELSNLKSVKLGWDFDKDLGDWLKTLKTNRGE